MSGDGVAWAVVACGGIVLVAEPPTIALLRRHAVLDMPVGRSSHSVPTPRGGGAPIAVGLLAAAALAPGAARWGPGFAFAVGFFGLLGLLDDLRGLPAISRLAWQAAGGVVAAALLVPRLPLPAAVTAAGACAGAVWLVGFVNVFNFMDGVNGISGAHALIGGVTYACLAWWRHDGFGVAAGLALAVAACAFLPWNAVRAKVFLGDVGSYSIGAALAVLAIRLIATGVPVEAVVGPVALYLTDVTWTLQRRIRHGECWHESHRGHVYQRWCDAGWSHQKVTAATSVLTMLLCLLGGTSLLGETAARAVADLAGLGVLAGYIGSPRLLAKTCLGVRNMRVLIVTHYFPPETGAPQARLSALAATWAADGDDVTVLTGMPSHPTGVLPPSYRWAVRRRERVDGYRVVRTWLYATPNEGFVRKTLCHLSFMASSVLLGWRAVGPADVVVVSSPTFFSILSGWLLARVKHARFVVEVRDLWPAIFVELGVLTSRLVIGALERLELAAYAAADQVVVVSEGFRADLIRRGVPPGKVHVIRNGVDVARFVPGEAPPAGWRERLGAAPGDCLVLYAGTHGISQALPVIADTVAMLERRIGRGLGPAAGPDGPPIRFAFVGDGADKARLMRRVEELGLSGVVLLPGVPNEEMPGLLAAADICLVPLRDVQLFASFIPSKLFEYLAAGKAVVGSVAGEAAKILAEAGAVVVPPEDSDALASAIAALAADPEFRAAIGKTGREYVERGYDRAALAREYRKILDLPPVA